MDRDRNNDMLDGYIDGLCADSPEPGVNRSYCYRYGFLNGRDDLRRQPRDTAANLRKMADEAERLDREISGVVDVR
jgi:hypothetical protein